MSGGSDDEALYVNISPVAKELVDADDRPNYKAVEDAILSHLADNEVRMLELQMDKLESDKEISEEKVREEKHHQAMLEEQIQKKRDAINRAREEMTDYMELVDSLLDEMAENKNLSVPAFSDEVKRIRKQPNTEFSAKEDVWEFLHDRSEERGLDIPDSNFDDSFNSQSRTVTDDVAELKSIGNLDEDGEENGGDAE